MKTNIMAFAIPLLVSGAAYAQSAPITAVPGTTTMVPVPDSSAPGGVRTETVTTPASSKVIQADNSNPRRDSAGTPVRSDAAVVPDGWNGVTGSTATGATVAPATGPVPFCSRTVTDHCKERGG